MHGRAVDQIATAYQGIADNDRRPFPKEINRDFLEEWYDLPDRPAWRYEYLAPDRFRMVYQDDRDGSQAMAMEYPEGIWKPITVGIPAPSP